MRSFLIHFQNYAGDLTLPSTHLVLNTIHSVFPACRLFRDNPPGEESSKSDFVNMVVFCTKIFPASAKGDKGFVFRQPDQNDIRGSLSRKQYLPPAADLEIDFDWPKDEEAQLARRVLKSDDTSLLEENHANSALSHWRIMRTVMPNAVWELW